MTVFRDVAMILVGGFVIVWGTVRGGEFVVFMAGISLMGGPAALHVIWLGRSATPSPPPQPPSPPSPPPS